MEKIAYAGWPNCVRLTNGKIELIATTDVGPRVIRLGFVGGQNLLREVKDHAGTTGGDDWRSYGGHRLWHAPEAKPRTYQPDNGPVKTDFRNGRLTLTQAIEKGTGIEKRIQLSLDKKSNRVTVVHRLTNRGLFGVELSPWALTVMAAGGRAILPQEPYRSHTEYLLPARPVVIWHYTDMSNPRWTWSQRYIQLRQDAKLAGWPQKVGLANAQGWAAYALGPDLFVKRFSFDADARYPDMGCNCEVFTNDKMLEVETLGPLATLAPGQSVEHTEQWFLFKANVGRTDRELDRKLGPLVKKTEASGQAGK